ncbi:MAG: hypothetical protein RQ833_00885 [Sphingomonadaceae bacterium]|nr:hypothetical protein [Sphingomonadaceae bacterium]
MAALNQFLLISVAVIAIGYLIYYLRKPRNRHPMQTPEGRAADQRRTDEVLNARAESRSETPQPRFNRS